MMKQYIYSYRCVFLILCIGTLFLSCERDKDVDLTTVSVVNEQVTPSYTSAEVQCCFQTEATLRNVYLQYSSTSDFSEYGEVAMWEEEGKYCTYVGELLDNTIYYIRYVVSNRYSSVLVDDISRFQTLQPSAPNIKIDSIGDLWDTHAKAYVTMAFDGGAPISKMGICWSTQSHPTIQDNKKESQTKTSVFDITSLQPNTTYYIRAYAENKKGVSYSEEKSFITFALPEVQTSDITDIQLTSALLAGSLIFDGNDATTIAGLCWGRDPEPTLLGNHQDLAFTNNIFSYTLSNLEDETQYYVRAYAQNKIGVVYGEEKSFTTQSAVIPTVITTDATNISYTTATVGGTITSDGGADITERGVCYSTTVNPTIENTKITSGTGTGTYTINLTELTDSTTYYVRAYAINKKGVNYGEEIIFMTEGYTLPEISTTQPTQVSYTSATIGGVIISNGGTEIIERGICYSTVKHPTIESSKIASGTGIGSFSVDLSNLTDSTTYYVRAYAINKKGVSYGEERKFTTKLETVPSIVTLQPSSIGCTSAMVGSLLVFDGGSQVTEQGICLATTPNPTIDDKKMVQEGEIGYQYWSRITELNEMTTYYVCAYAINRKGIAYGEEISFTTLNRIFENGYECVDMGLSVKWAAINIGANNPEDYGHYFAWGETSPKNYYDYSTYKFCGKYSYIFTKYNTSSSNGAVDNKTTLEPKDDAASVIWGGKWRMPTSTETYELINNCIWEWTTKNGINGHIVTSKKNGNSIFLPAAGRKYEDALESDGVRGYYWSSTLVSSYPLDARFLYFWGNQVSNDSFRRDYGRSVRPVCP